MRERYPDVRLHYRRKPCPATSTAMLNARQLDLAVLFDTHAARAAGPCCRCWKRQLFLDPVRARRCPAVRRSRSPSLAWRTRPRCR